MNEQPKSLKEINLFDRHKLKLNEFYSMNTLRKKIKPEFSQFQIWTDEFKKIQASLDELWNNKLKNLNLSQF